MDPRQSLESPRDTFRWLLHEGALIAGIFLFWIGIVFLLRTFLWLSRVVFEGFGLHLGVSLVWSVHDSTLLWVLAFLVAGATTTLYVFVRAGTILLEASYS